MIALPLGFCPRLTFRRLGIAPARHFGAQAADKGRTVQMTDRQQQQDHKDGQVAADHQPRGAGGQQHACVTRMGREHRHPSADGGQLALRIDGSEVRKDRQRPLQRLVIRLLIPGEARGFAPAGGQQE